MLPIPYSPNDHALFHEVVKFFDQGLRLHQHKPGDLLALAEHLHLHRRTGGYMKPLSQLICHSAQEAITTTILDNQLVGAFAEDPLLPG